MSNLDNIQEKELIEKCRNGDSLAFGLLLKNYKRQLYSYLYKLSGDNSQAEDLLQETLIKVWRGIKGYKEQNKFSSWLFSIAHNVSMDAIRKKSVRKHLINSDDFDNFSNNQNPHNLLVATEIKDIIQNTLNSLPEKQKRVFLLRQHGALSFKEIAELTGEPLNTVLGHMHYSVKKLKKVLREENVL